MRQIGNDYISIFNNGDLQTLAIKIKTNPHVFIIKGGKTFFRWSAKDKLPVAFVYDPEEEVEYDGMILINENHRSPRTFTTFPVNFEECALRSFIFSAIYKNSFILIEWAGKSLFIPAKKLFDMIEPIQDLTDKVNTIYNLMQ